MLQTTLVAAYKVNWRYFFLVHIHWVYKYGFFLYFFGFLSSWQLVKSYGFSFFMCVCFVGVYILMYYISANVFIATYIHELIMRSLTMKYLLLYFFFFYTLYIFELFQKYFFLTVVEKIKGVLIWTSKKIRWNCFTDAMKN